MKLHTTIEKSQPRNALKLCVSALALVSAPALAQTDVDAESDSQAQSGASEGSFADGTIVVTARSRAESIQDVPFAITAYSEEELDRRGFQGLQDIGQFTPGFTFESYGGGGGIPVIRGTQQNNFTIENNVVAFYDGLYLPRGYITDLGFSSVERIEVVKGPQSARYGRNAFMGVINYVPKKPTEELSGRVQATVGNHDRYDFSAELSGAAIPDTLRFSAGIDYSTFDGTWQNPHPFPDIDFEPGTDGRLGGWERLSYNIAAQFLPADNLTIDLSYRHFDIDEEAAPLNFFGELNANSETLNCGVENLDVRPTSGDWQRLYCGNLPVDIVGQDPRSYGRRLDTDIYRAQLNWDATDAININYLFGRIEANTSTLNYKDIVPGCTFFVSGLCIFENGPIGEVAVTSHELRIAYDDGGPLTFAVGGYITDESDVNISDVAGLPELTAPATEPITDIDQYALFFRQLSNETTTDIISGFFEASYEFLDDRARLSVEARYSEEKKSELNLLTDLSFEDTFKSFTPRVTAEYNLADDNMVFASVARGVKSGGFNSNAFLAENRTYEQETNWTYEIGSRNQFMNRQITLNLTAFWIDWNDVQIPSQNFGDPEPLATAITLNLGDVTSKGIEIDGAFSPNEHFTTYFSASYIDAKYAEGTIDLRWGRTPAVCDDIVCNSNGDIGGNRNQNSPKWQASVGAQYTNTFGENSDMEYYIRGDLGYRGRAPVEAVNLAYTAARTLVNGAIGVRKGIFEGKLWARNLFDEKYVSNALVGQPNVQYVSILGERRTFGFTLMADF